MAVTSTTRRSNASGDELSPSAPELPGADVFLLRDKFSTATALAFNFQTFLHLYAEFLSVEEPVEQQNDEHREHAADECIRNIFCRVEYVALMGEEKYARIGARRDDA